MSEHIDAIKKSQKLLFLIILLILIMGGYGGWALYKLLKNEGVADGAKPAEQLAAPLYMPLDTFTVNLINPDNDPERVLYIGLTLRLPDQPTHSELSNNLPEVRSRLLRLFSRQEAGSLSTEDGKQKLAAQIKTELGKPYFQGRANLVISDVLFTAFILR
jgi:flagellar FliL protein